MDRWIVVIEALAVPVLGFLGQAAGLMSRRHRLTKRIRSHAELIAVLPPDAAGPAKELLAAELRVFRETGLRVLNRKIDPGALVALLVIGVLGSAALFGGLRIGHWWAVATGSVIAFFCLLLMIVGGPQTYIHPEAGATQADEVAPERERLPRLEPQPETESAGRKPAGTAGQQDP